MLESERVRVCNPEVTERPHIFRLKCIRYIVDIRYFRQIRSYVRILQKPGDTRHCFPLPLRTAFSVSRSWVDNLLLQTLRCWLLRFFSSRAASFLLPAFPARHLIRPFPQKVGF